MSNDPGSLAELARRSSRGDASAAAELLDKLPTRVVHLVRRELLSPGGHPGLPARLRRWIWQLAADGGEPLREDLEEWLGRITRAVCELTVAQWREGCSGIRPVLDTIRD